MGHPEGGRPSESADRQHRRSHPSGMPLASSKTYVPFSQRLTARDTPLLQAAEKLPRLYAESSFVVFHRFPIARRAYTSPGAKFGAPENLPHENDRRNPARGVSIGRNLLRSSKERFSERRSYHTGRTSGFSRGRQRSDAVVPQKNLQVTNVN